MQGRAGLLGDAPPARLARRLAAVLLACAVVWPRAGNAATRTYVIAIGNNAPPASSDAGSEVLRPLHYADDDAADFYSFTRELSAEASLLTVLDRDSQQRFPELTAVAQPPTLAELRRTVERYRQRLERDRSSGVESVLLFFYSGHGSRSFEGQPALTLLDGALTQEVLYDEILARLPARFVPILVDACHAEAVVRPRDAQAEVVELTDEQIHGYVARATLERFPHAGALVPPPSATAPHAGAMH